MTEHTVKAYEQELRELTLLVGEMGMLAERQIRNAIAALIKRDEGLASQVIAADDAIDELQRRIGDSHDRQTPAIGQRLARDRQGIPHLHRPGTYRRLRQEHRQAGWGA